MNNTIKTIFFFSLGCPESVVDQILKALHSSLNRIGFTAKPIIVESYDQMLKALPKAGCDLIVFVNGENKPAYDLVDAAHAMRADVPILVLEDEKNPNIEEYLVVCVSGLVGKEQMEIHAELAICHLIQNRKGKYIVV